MKNQNEEAKNQLTHKLSYNTRIKLFVGWIIISILFILIGHIYFPARIFPSYIFLCFFILDLLIIYQLIKGVIKKDIIDMGSLVYRGYALPRAWKIYNLSKNKKDFYWTVIIYCIGIVLFTILLFIIYKYLIV